RATPRSRSRRRSGSQGDFTGTGARAIRRRGCRPSAVLPSSLLRARRRERRTGGTITRSRRRILTLLGLGLLGLGLLPLCFFTVDAGGVAIVTQFGDPVRVESAPGLHVKHPYPLQSVISLDRRLHILAPRPSE